MGLKDKAMKHLLIILTVTVTLFAASKLNMANEATKLETGYKTPIEVLKMAQKLGK